MMISEMKIMQEKAVQIPRFRGTLHSLQNHGVAQPLYPDCVGYKQGQKKGYKDSSRQQGTCFRTWISLKCSYKNYCLIPLLRLVQLCLLTFEIVTCPLEVLCGRDHIHHLFQFDLKQIRFKINVVKNNLSCSKSKIMHFHCIFYKHLKGTESKIDFILQRVSIRKLVKY